MAQPNENPVPLGEAETGLGDVDLRAANDTPDSMPKESVEQAENIASSITCASLRCSALRTATEIELDRLQVIILTAKSFNRDGLDDDADEVLRNVWSLLRASITPVRTELQKLRRTGR
jgi:predicted nucleic acid-binding protein